MTCMTTGSLDGMSVRVAMLLVLAAALAVCGVLLLMPDALKEKLHRWLLPQELLSDEEDAFPESEDTAADCGSDTRHRRAVAAAPNETRTDDWGDDWNSR